MRKVDGWRTLVASTFRAGRRQPRCSRPNVQIGAIPDFDGAEPSLLSTLFCSGVQEHREETALGPHLNNVVDANRIGLPALASYRRNHLKVGVLYDCTMYIIRMSWSDVVNALIEMGSFTQRYVKRHAHVRK